MDIYSGSGICIGENNFFTKFYNSSPVRITVEGSNTLTRGLIIFGQGLNKSHPYIFPIFQNIQDNNLIEFKNNFNSLLKNIVGNYFQLCNPFYFRTKDSSILRVDRMTIKFSILSNFIALLGGKIKQKQMISGNMADILSNLYLSYSLIWYHNHFDNKNILRDECINYLMLDAEYKMNLIISNYLILKPLLYPIKNNIKYTNFEDKNKLYKYILNNKELDDVFTKDIYYIDTVLEKLEKLSKIDKTSEEYKNLYQDIIKVDEYKI